MEALPHDLMTSKMLISNFYHIGGIIVSTYEFGGKTNTVYNKYFFLLYIRTFENYMQTFFQMENIFDIYKEYKPKLSQNSKIL